MGNSSLDMPAYNVSALKFQEIYFCCCTLTDLQCVKLIVTMHCDDYHCLSSHFFPIFFTSADSSIEGVFRIQRELKYLEN